jgi:hypothetical protein
VGSAINTPPSNSVQRFPALLRQGRQYRQAQLPAQQLLPHERCPLVAHHDMKHYGRLHISLNFNPEGLHINSPGRGGDAAGLLPRREMLGLARNAMPPLIILSKRTLPRTVMGTRRTIPAEALKSQRKEAIREIQAAVARELAKQHELPKTVPQRIADLVREMHRLLRERP